MSGGVGALRWVLGLRITRPFGEVFIALSRANVDVGTGTPPLGHDLSILRRLLSVWEYVVTDEWGYIKEKAQVRLLRPDLGAITHFRTFPGVYGPVTDRAERV